MKKTYLDLSTGHLSRDTMNLLDKAGYQYWHAVNQRLPDTWPAMSLGQYPHGYFITVPNIDDADVIEQLKAVPQDLRCCLLFAASEGAELIRFDADGYVDGDLPWFQEV